MRKKKRSDVSFSFPCLPSIHSLLSRLSLSHLPRSAYTDADIDLVPEPDFWASAAPELTAAAKAGGPHALMVARLEHERAGRAAAVAGLASARTANEALERTVAAKRRFLNDLQADLAAVAGAVEPLRARLRLAPPAVSGGSALAHADAAAAILPGPLHLAYALLAGCAQAYPELGVSVGFAAAAAVEGGGGRGRRPSTAGGAAGEPPAVAASSAIADPAPPLVTLTFSGGEAAEEGEGEPPTSPPHPPFTLALRWLPGLRLLSAGPLRPGGGGGGDVGAAATAAAAALRAAFPGDDGASPPSEAASQLLAAGGTADAAAAFAAAFPSTRPDRPSRWVQLLGGLDLRPPAEAGGEAATLPPGALGLMRSQQRAYSVLAALRESC